VVKKRGKDSWLIRIYLGRGVDGKEKYYCETFHAPLKSMAVAREQELKRQLQRLGPKTGANTLGEWLERWLEDCKDTIADVTWRGYAKHVRRLKPLVGHLHLYTLNTEALRQALRGKLDGLSPRTQRNITDTLRTAIRAGIEARIIPQDALLGWKTVKVPRKDRPVLDREGLLRLAAASEEYKYGLVIRLLCVTGARLGEVLALTWDKVDWERKTITIDRAADTMKRKLKDDTKTFNARRTVVLDEETVRKLAEHRKRQMADSVRPLRKENLVFQAPSGKPPKYNIILYEFKRALEKAGLLDMRIHDIRHSVVTLLLKEGVPPILVAALVGHNVATTTTTYAQQVKVSKSILLD